MARRAECRLPDGNGVLTEDNMKPLLAALIAVLAFVTRANAQPVADHLKCYKVNDPQAKTKYTADLDVVSGTEGGISEPGCTIKVPAIMACVPTVKANVNPTPPGIPDQGTPNSFFCYKVKCQAVARPALNGTAMSDGSTWASMRGLRI